MKFWNFLSYLSEHNKKHKKQAKTLLILLNKGQIKRRTKTGQMRTKRTKIRSGSSTFVRNVPNCPKFAFAFCSVLLPIKRILAKIQDKRTNFSRVGTRAFFQEFWLAVLTGAFQKRGVFSG